MSVGRYGSGDLATGPGMSARLSADGSTVAFAARYGTRFTNHADSPATSFPRIFAWREGTVRLISVNVAGTTSVGAFDPALSADGRYVAFRTAAAVVSTTPKANCDICGNTFVRDLDTETTAMASVNAAGTASGAGGPTPYPPQISADGRYVTFWGSGMTGLVPTTDPRADDGAVFQRDMEAGVTIRVTQETGLRSGWDYAQGSFAASADGRYVAYVATGRTFMADVVDFCDQGAPNFSCMQVYLFDTATGTTSLVSRTSYGEKAGGTGPLRISADGQVVLFQGRGPLLAGASASSAPTVFRYRRSDGRVQQVVDPAHVPSCYLGPVSCTALSADGTTIAFMSAAPISASDSDAGLTDAYLITTNPTTRGIQPVVTSDRRQLVAAGHVPCPRGATRVTLTISQGTVSRSGSTRVACDEPSEQWEVRMERGGLVAGPAQACAAAVTTDGAFVVNEVSWCRTVEIR